MTTTPEPASPAPEPVLQQEGQAVFGPAADIPAVPVPLAAYIVPGHHPDCDGTCGHTYPYGCSPF